MKQEREDKIIKYVRSLIFRCMLLVVMFLFMAIMCKNNQVFKDYITTNIYTNNFKFVKIKNLYEKYLGGIVPLEKLEGESVQVFKEQLNYTTDSIYYDGVKLEVSNNYLVPVITSGMVVFIGDKDNYGKTIIIEGVDGVDIWYGNMNGVNVQLYDYVESGTLLGNTLDNTLFLVYNKDGKYLDYHEYLP